MFASLDGMAQSPMAYLEFGDSYAQKGQWEEAYAYYSKAVALDSTIFLAIYKMAEAAQKTKRYQEALNFFEKSYAKDEGKLMPDELFHMASIQKTLGRYEDALVNFKKYTKKNSKNKKSDNYKKAMQEIETCTWILSYKNKKAEYDVKRLHKREGEEQSENINKIESGKIYYSAFNHASEEWQIEKAGIDDSLLIDVEVVAKSKDASYANLTSSNAGEWYFTFCDSTGCEIRKTISATLDLNSSEPLRTIGCNNCNTSMPFITEVDGEEYLFFVSDRMGGEGGMDIWFAKSSNGTFINPENAGPIVNTPGDEVAPSYYNGALYFSSDWHKGFGGFDIVKITGTPSKWGFPENIGKEFNSSYNDMYYREQGDSLIYLSSNRPADEKVEICCNDIFEYKKKITQKIDEQQLAIESLSELNSILPVTLYFHNDEPNPRSVDSTTVLTYYEAYNSYLNRYDEYKKAVTLGLSVEGAEDQVSELDDFYDLKVKKGFADLRLFKKLLLSELEQGKSIKIQVRGFASPRAKSDYNKRLTQRRIASLVNDMRIASDSVFAPYMNGTAANGAQLVFEALPFGEDQSAKNVSDDLKNEKESIYSRGARLERKIEIQTAILEKNLAGDSTSIYLEEESFDFGKISKFGTVHHDFILKNTTAFPLQIDSVVASCGCTEPVLPDMIIPANGELTMDVGFSPFGGRGREFKFVTIYLHGEKPRVITISADIQD
ncbi:MAG: DUF1573 domain-containing protein [Flavobacteriales bacterium]